MSNRMHIAATLAKPEYDDFIAKVSAEGVTVSQYVRLKLGYVSKPPRGPRKKKV